jgi:hypothetical protein
MLDPVQLFDRRAHALHRKCPECLDVHLPDYALLFRKPRINSTKTAKILRKPS